MTVQEIAEEFGKEFDKELPEIFNSEIGDDIIILTDDVFKNFSE